MKIDNLFIDFDKNTLVINLSGFDFEDYYDMLRLQFYKLPVCVIECHTKEELKETKKPDLILCDVCHGVGRLNSWEGEIQCPKCNGSGYWQPLGITE